MSNLTWLDLYNFLSQQANKVDNFGKFDWSSKVTIHDAETGDERDCETFFISDNEGNEKFVLVVNSEHIFNS